MLCVSVLKKINKKEKEKKKTRVELGINQGFTVHGFGSKTNKNWIHTKIDFQNWNWNSRKKKRMGLESIFPSPFMCGIGTEIILIYF